jgi:hypothetical protein
MGLKGSGPFRMSKKTMNPKASFVFIHGSDVKAVTYRGICFCVEVIRDRS